MRSPLYLQAIDYYSWGVAFCDADGQSYVASASSGWAPEACTVLPPSQPYQFLDSPIECSGYKHLLGLARDELDSVLTWRHRHDISSVGCFANWRLESSLDRVCQSDIPTEENVLALCSLLESASSDGLQDRAIATIEWLLHRHGASWHPGGVSRKLAAALGTVGRRAIASGQLSLAQDALRKSIVRSLSAAERWDSLSVGYDLGQLYLAQGRFGAAADIAAKVAGRLVSGDQAAAIRSLLQVAKQSIGDKTAHASRMQGLVEELNEMAELRELFCAALNNYPESQRRHAAQMWPEKSAYALEFLQALRDLVPLVVARNGENVDLLTRLRNCVAGQVSTWADWLALSGSSDLEVQFLEEQFDYLSASPLVGLRLAKAYLWQEKLASAAAILQRSVDDAPSASTRDSMVLAHAHYALMMKEDGSKHATAHSIVSGRLDTLHIDAGRSWVKQDWEAGFRAAGDMLRRLSSGGIGRMRTEFEAESGDCAAIARMLTTERWQGFFLDKRFAGLPGEFGEMSVGDDDKGVSRRREGVNGGVDYVGGFVLSNVRHGEGHVEFIKSYKTHSVKYYGHVVGRGLYGWNEVGDHVGGFALWQSH